MSELMINGYAMFFLGVFMSTMIYCSATIAIMLYYKKIKI